jgi:hypothetical protein
LQIVPERGWFLSFDHGSSKVPVSAPYVVVNVVVPGNQAVMVSVET